jgi:hypothetical protein
MLSNNGQVAYLSLCSMYREGAEYLPEWIEFHLAVGVERFFLYNNRSTDNHREVLAPYVKEGIVTVRDWPLPLPPALSRAFDDCLSMHRDDSRWIGFLDTDEFLYSPTGQPLPKVLEEFEQWPAVGVNWALFGTSGHVEKPDGLVIENYVRRTGKQEHGTPIKSIVDPRRTLRCRNSHHFRYESGTAVDENQRPIERWHTESPSYTKLKVNHYWTMSEAECRRKLELWSTTGRPRNWNMFRALLDDLDEVYDDEITRYAPAVREALEARSRSSPSSRLTTGS